MNESGTEQLGVEIPTQPKPEGSRMPTEEANPGQKTNERGRSADNALKEFQTILHNMDTPADSPEEELGELVVDAKANQLLDQLDQEPSQPRDPKDVERATFNMYVAWGRAREGDVPFSSNQVQEAQTAAKGDSAEAKNTNSEAAVDAEQTDQISSDENSSLQDIQTIIESTYIPADSPDRKQAEAEVDKMADKVLSKINAANARKDEELKEIAERPIEERLKYEARERMERAKAKYWMYSGWGMACGGIVPVTKEQLIDARTAYKMAKGDLKAAKDGNFEPLKVGLTKEAETITLRLQSLESEIAETQAELERVQTLDIPHPVGTDDGEITQGSTDSINAKKEDPTHTELSRKLSYREDEKNRMSKRKDYITNLLAA